MSKKPCFRGPLERQHEKWVQTLLHSEFLSPLQYLLNTSEVGTLEKLFFSNTQNPKIVC